MPKSVKAPVKTSVKKAVSKKPVPKGAEKQKKPAGAKKPEVTPTVTKKPEKSVKPTGLTANVVGADGTVVGNMTLPKELFGVKVNTSLLAQSVRVYLANQRKGSAATKTRGMVEGSTRKIYRQKGTGKARHGSIRAPIFVGGGVVFGPHPRDYSLQMSKKMKKAALSSALTSKYRSGDMVFVEGLETLEPKTRAIHAVLQALGVGDKVLVVMSAKADGVKRAAQNLGYADTLPVDLIHPYTLLTHKKIVFMKPAVEEGLKHFLREGNA